jgi:tetratricopeptide (TPR) repeat protein
MNKLLMTLAVVGVTAVVLTAAIRWRTPSRRAEPTAVGLVAANENAAEKANQVVPQSPTDEPVDTVVAAREPSTPLPTPPVIQPTAAAPVSPLVQPLVSRQSSYAQKQAAWKQLRDAHQLDEAVTELVRAMEADPNAAEYPAALGIAYVQQLWTLEDFREQSILAIKADQAFDQALELDPANWDARFWKAASLSYWPEGLNKSSEVIDQFVTLVEQQEKQTPEPQFAETYVRLGEQYQKAGYSDDAKAIWQRGASLFPDNTTLRDKLATVQ